MLTTNARLRTTIFSIMFLCALPPVAPATEQQELFTDGMNGVPHYRIPALAVTGNGVVVAVCDARYGRGQDLPNNIDLVMRRSFDSGDSWSDAKVIADLGAEGCGDAALLLDKSNNRLWCFFVHAPEGVGVRTSRPGIDGPTFRLQLMHSDDDGATWSAPRNINAEVKDPAWDAVWSSPGQGYQDTRGRLWFPLSRKSGDEVYSHFIYSDDRGESWHITGPAGTATNECMLVELKDATLLANMRSNAGLNRRAVSVSRDRGKTWTAFRHHEDLVGPVCQATLAWYDAARTTLLFANPAHTERRTMTLKYSNDEGKTWTTGTVLHEGPAAYSSLATLPDGTVGVFYERGDANPYETLTFAKIPIHALSK